MNKNERKKENSGSKSWAFHRGGIWFVAVSGVRVFRLRGFMQGSRERFLVLHGKAGFFREWLRLNGKHEFRFSGHLVCARGFPLTDRPLAQGFQKFLREHGYDTEIYEVEGNRLLCRAQPQPYRQKTIMRRMRSESGIIFIIELLLVCAVMLILAAVALPNLLQMRISENQATARKQVLRVLDAISSVNICAITAGCNPAPVQPLIPAPGTITQSGYTYTFQQNGANWSYLAVPVAAGFSGHQSYFVNQDGILRCGVDATAAPC